MALLAVPNGVPILNRFLSRCKDRNFSFIFQTFLRFFLPKKVFSLYFFPNPFAVSKAFLIFALERFHLLMIDRAQTIEKLRSTREYLSEHYGVSSMLLFGSVARNEQKEGSDVDVCVEMKPNLFKQAGVKCYLQEMLNCPVDVVRMRENMNQLFKQQILKYGVRVY